MHGSGVNHPFCHILFINSQNSQNSQTTTLQGSTLRYRLLILVHSLTIDAHHYLATPAYLTFCARISPTVNPVREVSALTRTGRAVKARLYAAQTISIGYVKVGLGFYTFPNKSGWRGLERLFYIHLYRCMYWYNVYYSSNATSECDVVIQVVARVSSVKESQPPMGCCQTIVELN